MVVVDQPNSDEKRGKGDRPTLLQEVVAVEVDLKIPRWDREALLVLHRAVVPLMWRLRCWPSYKVEKKEEVEEGKEYQAQVLSELQGGEIDVLLVMHRPRPPPVLA